MRSFTPTHRITFTPVSGEPEVFDVWLEPEEFEGDGPAYTREEWESSTRADWERNDGVWTFQGQATPGGASGRVRVCRLDEVTR